jgi:hypothetical protein
MARVAWNPFSPGITTSINTKSGWSRLAASTPSSPLAACITEKPAFVRIPSRKVRSVGESSTTNIVFTTMINAPFLLFK